MDRSLAILLGGATAASTVAARTYSLNQSFAGESFFDSFDFYTGDDPTHGYVDFVNRTEAEQLSLIGYDSSSGLVYMGAEHESIVPWESSGRKSVRLESKYETSGDVLMVIDMEHMPSSSGHLPDGCGVWPAFWTFGPDWPNNGEIDIIEYVNNQEIDGTTLHTSDNCVQSQEDTSTFTGTWGVNMNGDPATDCDVNAPNQWQNAGCGINGDAQPVGAKFNQNGGGVYALEWVSDTEMNAFYFARDSIPNDLANKNPTPSNWGLPFARFEVGTSECSSDHFNGHKIIFDLTFCGKITFIW